MNTAIRTLVLAFALTAPLHAQAVSAPLEIEASVARPFGPGEKLTYAVKVPLGGGGTAVAEIIGIDTVRGREVYHSVFRVNGSMLLFKVRDLYESWFDPTIHRFPC